MQRMIQFVSVHILRQIPLISSHTREGCAKILTNDKDEEAKKKASIRLLYTLAKVQTAFHIG